MMKAVLAFVATCCLSFTIHASPFTITVPESKERALGPKDYRLDEFIQPTNYKIELKLEKDFEVTKKFTVTKCEITFNVLDLALVENKKKIRIHYASDFTERKLVELFRADGQKIPVKMADPNPVTEIAEISFAEDLVKGVGYNLTFTGLTGTLRDNMSGFYLSEYVHGGVKKYVATTQFQSTDARAAFPCFDEPSFKAKFDISITRPTMYKTVLGNTEKKNVDEVVGEIATTTFKTTPEMSTYLVAFIVSTFDKLEDPTYPIFVPEGLTTSAEYAKAITPKIINSLGVELKILYTALGNEQLYQAALPDFSAGAMENWGLVTYRETALLLDPKESSARNKQRVCSIIAHELSHMWFGNSVTMSWWSDTWLNEGFARYFEYHTTANVEKEFDMANQFVVEQQQVIFNADAFSSASPLSSKQEAIFTPAQIESKFSTISYNKGGSVLRMVERAMGKPKFLEALNTYLMENAKKNTNADQLIKAFEAKGLKVGAMDKWVKTSGYPVVNVTREGNDILLTQKRFFLDMKESAEKWTIPITYANKKDNSDYSKTLPQIWMEENVASTTKIEDGFKDTEIIILNVQGSGYYRVNYEKELGEKINDQLRTDRKGGIPPLNRAILIDDVMNMARAGYQTYDTALDLTKYLSNEVDYYPWVAAFNSFAFLRMRIVEQEAVNWFKDYIVRMSDKLYKSVSFDIKENQNHTVILKTTLALQWACELGVASCITKSKELFASYVANKVTDENPINPNLRSVVYCNGIREGAKIEWDFLHGKFVLPTTAASEKVTIISALGCSKDNNILKTFLGESLDSAKIRKQDAYSVFTSVVNGNPGNINVAYQFMVDNFKTIPTKYANKAALVNIFNVLADRFTTSKQITDFEKFLTDNALGEAVAAGESAVKAAKANLEWTVKVQETIRSWLGRERGAAPSVTASVLVVAMAVVVTFLY